MSVLKEIKANYTQSEGRAVGGVLTITENEIRFSPNKVDDLSGGVEISIPISEISDVGVEKKFSGGLKDTLSGGGLRDRLRIKRANGPQELFVVSDLNDTIDTINSVANSRAKDDEENIESRDIGDVESRDLENVESLDMVEVEHQKGQLDEESELGSLLSKGAAYLLGGLSLLLGLLYLGSGPISAGLLFIVGGVIGFPYTRDRLTGLLSIRVSKWTATVIFVVCWLSASQLLA